MRPLLISTVICFIPWSLANILADIIDKDYDNLLSPKINEETVFVNVTLSLLQLRYVKPHDLTFTVDLFMHQYWIDHRLNFPSNGVTEDSVTLHGSWSNKLWIPDIFFENGISGDISAQRFKISYIVLYNNKTVFMASRVTVELVCEMDFTYYPHDSHKCSINLMSLSDHRSTVELQLTELILSKRLHHNDYHVESDSKQRCDRIYAIGNFSCVSAVLKMSRKAGHFHTKYIPSFTVVIASFASFWVPITSYPARASLVVTSLLALITQQIQITSAIKTSYYVVINVWTNLCTTVVFLCLLEFALAVVWESKQRKGDGRRKSKIDFMLQRFEKEDRNAVDEVAKYVFPIMFTLFCFLYYFYVKFL